MGMHFIGLTPASRARYAFFVLHSVAGSGAETLVTRRGPYYGLPFCQLSSEQPSMEELCAAVAGIAHLTGTRGVDFVPLIEYRGIWGIDTPFVHLARFLLVEPKGISVFYREARGALVPLDERVESLGIPDEGFDRLVVAKGYPSLLNGFERDDKHQASVA